MKKSVGITFNLLRYFSWLLNFAALLGYILLRRQMNAPQATDHRLRFLIIRPYKSEVDEADRVMTDSERDEMELMRRLFVTAREYGNCRVVVVTNHGDPGLAQIRAIAANSPATLVQVIEAPPMPADTASGQMFNHKVGWAALKDEARDEDILLTTDCDSDLTIELLQQIAKAYENPEVGGVGTYPLYVPAHDLAAMCYTMAINPSVGFLALSSLFNTDIMPGNLLSTRVSVFHHFKGYDSYSRIEQLVDDVAISKKVRGAGHKLALVGDIRVYNRYSAFVPWWQRWTRMTVMLKRTAPALYWPSPLPTYGAQVLAEVLLVYGLVGNKRTFVTPFFANLAVNGIYGSITGAWRDSLFSPISAVMNTAGWAYALVGDRKQVKWRGLTVDMEEHD